MWKLQNSSISGIKPVHTNKNQTKQKDPGETGNERRFELTVRMSYLLRRSFWLVLPTTTTTTAAAAAPSTLTQSQKLQTRGKNTQSF